MDNVADIHQAGLAQLGERQTEVNFTSPSEGRVFDPHKPHSFAFCFILFSDLINFVVFVCE